MEQWFKEQLEPPIQAFVMVAGKTLGIMDSFSTDRVSDPCPIVNVGHAG